MSVSVTVAVAGRLLKGGDVLGEGVNGGADLNVGHGVNSGVADGSSSDEVVSCVTIIPHPEHDSLDSKLEVTCVSDAYVKDSKGSG